MLEADVAATRTAARLAEITGQSESNVQRQLLKLEKVKVIERRSVIAKGGRGRAFHLYVRHTEQTEKLLKELGAGRTKKRTT